MVKFVSKHKNKNPLLIEMNGKEVDLHSLKPRSVTLKEYKTVRANSDAREALYSKLNNEALAHVAQVHLNNISKKGSPVTYEDSLSEYIVPELLKRFK